MQTEDDILVVGPRQKTEIQIAKILNRRMHEGKNLIITDSQKGKMKKMTADTANACGYRVAVLGAPDGYRTDVLRTTTAEERKMVINMLPFYLLGNFFMGELETKIKASLYEWMRVTTAYAIGRNMTLDGLYRFAKENPEELAKVIKKTSSMIKRVPEWRALDDIMEVTDIIKQRLSGTEIQYLSSQQNKFSELFSKKTVVYLQIEEENWILPYLTERLIQLAEKIGDGYTVVMNETSMVKRAGHGNTIVQFGTDDVPAVQEIQKSCGKVYVCV